MPYTSRAIHRLKEKYALVDLQFSMASRKLHHRSFWTSWALSHLPNPCISHSIRIRLGVHLYDAFNPCQNRCWGYEKRKEKRLLAFTSAAVPHQLSIRTNAMPLVEDPRTPLPPLPKLSPLRLRLPKPVWRLPLKSGCNILNTSHMLSPSQNFLVFSCVILSLCLGLTPIFTVIDCYPYWIRYSQPSAYFFGM